MNRDEKNSIELAAYHDGELSWWGRWRVERHLRESAALGQELAELSDVSEWVREIESGNDPLEIPDLWSEIGPALSQIDREVAPASVSTRARDAGTESRGFGNNWNWASLAATGAVAMLVLAVLIDVDPTAVESQLINSLDNEHAIAEHSSLGVVLEVSSGSLRYLQTNGVSYVVSQDSEDVTIIWLMDENGDSTS